MQEELAGSGWWGENTLRASSSMTMSPNHKLAWKRRLSASPAAWRGGANSFGHHCLLSILPLLAATVCKVQPPRSPAGLLQGHGCCLATAAPICRVWREGLSAVTALCSLLCKQLTKICHRPDDRAFFIYSKPGRLAGERFY